MNTVNTSYYRIIIYAVLLLLLLPCIEGNAQELFSSAEQNTLKKTAEDIRADAALSRQEKMYMFQFRMRKMMMEKMRRSGGNIWGWEATEWQKTLPDIAVQDKGATQKYSFTDLIKADGYLCPGSARAYKALQVALPILYENSTPVKGDFKITHGAALCTSLVYDFFMQGYTDKKFLELDSSIRDKLIRIERLSTGKKVTVVFPFSDIRGHTPEAAKAGDIILRAREGDGMTIHVEEPDEG